MVYFVSYSQLLRYVTLTITNDREMINLNFSGKMIILEQALMFKIVTRPMVREEKTW